MHLAHLNVLSPSGEILDNIIIESPDSGTCQCELYALTITNFNKIFCLKCQKRFQATNRKRSGKRIFVYDRPIQPQTYNQLQHQIVTAKIAEAQLTG